MTPELIIIIFLVAFMVLLLLMLFYFEMIKCRHIWEEQSRSNWKRLGAFFDSYGDLVKVELRCAKCGNIKIVEI